MHFNTHGKKLDELGSNRPAPGIYHVMVNDATEKSRPPEKGGGRYVQVDMQVLNGTVPGQEGKTITQFFYLDGKQAALDNLLKFLMCTGVIHENEAKDIDFQTDLPGSQLVVEAERDEYQGKSRIKLSFGGFWPVDHPEVKRDNIPLDNDMAKAFLKGERVNPAPAAAAVPAAVASGAAEAKDAPAQDEWADL